MPTYHVRPIPERPLSFEVHYPLICEQCGQTLGKASSPADLAGLSAAAVLGLWPQLRHVVEIHEAACTAIVLP
jgi:hypothetical protein